MDQPSWLTGRAAAAASSESTGGGDVIKSQSAPADSGPRPAYYAAVSWTFTIASMGCMVFLAATGALGVASANGVDSTGTVFVGLYLLIFSAIEFTWEVAQLMPKDNYVDTSMKKNFGFLYGHVGRGLFFIMCGILAFGLSDPRKLALACGVVVAAWGLIMILGATLKPEYFPKKVKYVPP